jgi:predicted nucleic acid-binding protein
LALFADTSALFALLDRDDAFHEEALTFARSLRETELVTHNYVVVEAIAVVQSRLSAAHMRQLVGRLLPSLTIEWIGRDLHAKAISALLTSSRRGPTFVDLVSFEVMRRGQLDTAFAFDRHFVAAGFRVVP